MPRRSPNLNAFGGRFVRAITARVTLAPATVIQSVVENRVISDPQLEGKASERWR
jgi:hypothetical protein